MKSENLSNLKNLSNHRNRFNLLTSKPQNHVSVPS